MLYLDFRDRLRHQGQGLVVHLLAGCGSLGRRNARLGRRDRFGDQSQGLVLHWR